MDTPLLPELWAASRSIHEIARELEAVPAEPPIVQGLALAGLARRYLFDAIDGRSGSAEAIERAEGAALRAAAELAGCQSALGSRLLASVRTLLTVEVFPAREAQAPQPEWPQVTGLTPEPHRVVRVSVVPRYRAQPLPPRRARDVTPPPIELRGESVTSAADLERAVARFEALARDSLAAALAPRPRLEKDPFAEPSTSTLVDAFAVDPARSRPLTPRGLVDRRVDELFQEIRMGGVQRTPQRGESFDSVAGIEKRMFESVDAIVAFGADALDSLERLGGDSPAPDASRVFATAFLASTIRGADLVAIAERVLELHGAGDEEMLAAFVEGLALGPSPDVDGALAGLTRHPAVALRRAAYRTLTRRFGCGPSLALAGAEDSDPSVAFTAVGELFRLRHPEARNRLEAAFALPGLDAPPLALRRAMVEALAFARDPRLIALLEASLDAKGARQVSLELAVVGDARTASLLEHRARLVPSEEGVLALGFAGSLDAIPVLVTLLSHEDEPIADAAARSLARLLGVFPMEEALLAPEKLDEIAFPAEEGAKSASPGSPDRVRRVARDPAFWKSEAQRVAQPAIHSLRVRHGLPWTAIACAEELAAHVLPAPPSPLERALLHLELTYRAGSRARFSTSDLVVTQEAQLALLLKEARASSTLAGQF